MSHLVFSDLGLGQQSQADCLEVLESRPTLIVPRFPFSSPPMGFSGFTAFSRHCVTESLVKDDMPDRRLDQGYC